MTREKKMNGRGSPTIYGGESKNTEENASTGWVEKSSRNLSKDATCQS